MRHSSYDCSVMHYVLNSDTDSMIGYFSLLATVIIFDDNTVLPTIEVKMFALNKEYRKTGISVAVVNSIIDVAKNYAHNNVGAEIILAQSIDVQKVVDTYRDCGFEEISADGVINKTSFNLNCRPMIIYVN